MFNFPQIFLLLCGRNGRKMVKKLIIITFVLFVLAIIGASVYVSTIDWDKHKNILTEQLAEITGKKVLFNGPVSMSVFPMPYITAKNVSVHSAVSSPDEPPLMKIDSVVAKLSFSALLGGSFDVKMMSLVKPEILFQKTDEGINWIDDAKTNTDVQMKDIHIALDSVVLTDADVHILDENHHIDTHLQNLKAEIIADSLHGPYRIDGSYIKDGNPQGFAISMGNLSDSFASNLNFVLSQPSSDSYLRFDGTFLLSNSVANGNLILESKNIKKFYDTFVPGKKLAKYLDNEVAASMELKLTHAQLELANLIIKYGKTTGAGNIIIPLKDKSYVIGEDESHEKPEVSVKLDMTEWDLSPIVQGIQEFAQQQLQDDNIYDPDYPFNLNLTLNALKADYNNQTVKDLAIKATLKDDTWQFNNISGLFPGNTQLKLFGKAFPVEDVFSYTLTWDSESENTLKFLEWLRIPVKTVAGSTYQKSQLQAEIIGDTKGVKISPFSLNIDNIALTGHFGAKRGTPPHYALEVSTDNLILDNYIPRLFEDGVAPQDAITRLWNETKWANDVDFDLKLKVGLLIYEKVSFDKFSLNASLQKGILNIAELSINDVLQSNVSLSGEIGGFGDKLQISNLNYKITGKEYKPWLNKFNIEEPKLKLSNFQPFESSGVVSFNAGRIWLKTENLFGRTQLSYVGRISDIDKDYSIEGDVQLKSPNAFDLLKSINSPYLPQDERIGRLALSSHIAGNINKYKLSSMKLSLGANTFQGAVGLDNPSSVPYIVANLQINRFEWDRFRPQGESKSILIQDKSGQKNISLWNKPNISDQPFDIDSFEKCQFVLNLDVREFVFGEHLLKNLQAKLENRNNELSLNEMHAGYNEGDILANLKFVISETPRLVGDFSVTNQKIFDLGWIGNVYGVKSGTLELNGSVDTAATSPRQIMDNFNGTLNLNINSPVIKGWNFGPIIADLQSRTHSEGLSELVQENLKTGETVFKKFSGRMSSKDGVWFIDRAQLTSEDATVEITGGGALGPWQMNDTFTVQLTEPKRIQPFRFSLKGDMAHPELDVDVTPITKVYDDHFAQLEAEKRRKQEEYENGLRQTLKDNGKILAKIKTAFDEFVDNAYRKQVDKFSDEKYKAELTRFDDRIDKQRQNFAEADKILQYQDIKAEYPERVAEINEQAKKEIENINKEIQELYLQYLKELVLKHYEDIQALAEDKATLMKSTLDEKESLLKRLVNAQTSYRFQNDEKYAPMAESVAQEMANFDEMIRGAYLYNEGIEAETDIALLEKYVNDSADMLVKAQRQSDAVHTGIDRYLGFMEEKVKREENALENRRKAEALKKEQKAKEAEAQQAKTVSAKQNVLILSPGSVVKTGSDAEPAQPTTVHVDVLGEVPADDLEVNLLQNESSASGSVSGTVRRGY